MSDVELTDCTIISQASEGKYYSYSTGTWRSIHLLESVIRTILSRMDLMYTVEQACIKYSWESLEVFTKLPESLTQSLEKNFYDSRNRSHPLNSAAASITALFCRTFSTFTIEQALFRRFFTVKEKDEVIWTIASSAYAKLDFYDQNQQLVYVNFHDCLTQLTSTLPKWHVSVKSVWSILWQNRIKYINSNQIDLFPESDLGRFDPRRITVGTEGDDRNYVFRDSDKKIVAIATYRRILLGENWDVHIFPENKTDKILLVWILLKDSQTRLGNPDRERRYVKDPFKK